MKAAFVLTAALACAGCASTATEIVVVVDSDLRPGMELAEVVVIVGDAEHQFPIASAADLPLSFGVIPGPGQSHEGRVQITVDGRDSGGNSLVETHAVTTFRPERRLVLPLPLARSCVAIEDCEDMGGDETCRDGMCQSAIVDSATLQTGDGSGVRLFDGPSEGDAGTRAMDAGPACEAGASCEANQGCATGTVACTPEAECVGLTPAPAGTPCQGGGGRECDGMGACGR